MVSPAELIKRGVPVSRLVHRAGSFAITFPNAYHAGFNTGFNCAEAVNFGPPDWLPAGSAAAEHYRKRGKPATISHDALVVSCCRAARVSETAVRSGEGRAAEEAEQAEIERDLAVGLAEAEAAAERERQAAVERLRQAELAAQRAAEEEEARRQRRYEQQEARALEEAARNAKRRDAESRLRAEAEARDTIAARKSSRASARNASAAWASMKAVTQRERAAFRAAAGVEAAAAKSAAAGGGGGGGGKGGCGKRSFAAVEATFPAAAEKTAPAPPQTPDAAPCCAVPEQLRLSAADPPRPEQVPVSGVRLAAGELAVRIDEERRRRREWLRACCASVIERGGGGEAAAAAATAAPFGQECRMSGKGSGSTDPFDGAPADGEDADCEVCKCDLWLSAVVAVPAAVLLNQQGELQQQRLQQQRAKGGGARAASAAAATRPRVDRRMTCPEHAPALGLPPDRLRLLYRHTLPELEGLVADACRWVPGASEAVAAARAAAADPGKGKAAAVPVGPLPQDTALRRKLEVERAEKRARKKAEAARAEQAAAEAAAAGMEEAEEEEEKDPKQEEFFGAAAAPSSLLPPPGDLFPSSPAPVAWD